jgi:hypothetical protein
LGQRLLKNVEVAAWDGHDFKERKMSTEQPNPSDYRTEPQIDRGVRPARVVGPDAWARARQRPVPVRLVRTVRSGIGIGVGIVIVQLIVALVVGLLLSFGLIAL